MKIENRVILRLKGENTENIEDIENMELIQIADDRAVMCIKKQHSINIFNNNMYITEYGRLNIIEYPEILFTTAGFNYKYKIRVIESPTDTTEDYSVIVKLYNLGLVDNGYEPETMNEQYKIKKYREEYNRYNNTIDNIKEVDDLVFDVTGEKVNIEYYGNVASVRQLGYDFSEYYIRDGDVDFVVKLAGFIIDVIEEKQLKRNPIQVIEKKRFWEKWL